MWVLVQDLYSQSIVDLQHLLNSTGRLWNSKQQEYQYGMHGILFTAANIIERGTNTMSKFVGRLSGIVSYSDGSHEQFAAHMDERGNISVNSGVSSTYNESNHALREVTTDNNDLESMLALVKNTLTFLPSGSATKTVNGLVAELSGRIARDNDTWEDFCVQYTPQMGAMIVEGSGTGQTAGAYQEFRPADLTAWFESIMPDVTL